VTVLQSEIAGAIATEIQTNLTPQEQARLAKTRLVNPAAYEAYLHGRFLLNRHSVEQARKALKDFQQAIDIDPNYAPAYSGLSDSYQTFQQFGGMPNAWPIAKAAAIRAIELDDTLAEAHRSLANGLLWHDWDWAESEREFQRALQLNPGDAETYALYSIALAYTGRPNEAIAKGQRALELDPLSPRMAVAIAYYFARQYDRAIEQARRVVKLDPTHVQSHRWLGLAYEAQGKFAEAIDEFKLTVKLSPENLTYLGNLARLYAVAGKKTEARRTFAQVQELSKNQYFPPLMFGIIYAALGEKDQAFAWLDKAYDERNPNLVALSSAPWFDPLRSDPRFDELARRVEATMKRTQISNHSSAK
jgi:tetratricopeptide (TPR) repeat protein